MNELSLDPSKLIECFEHYLRLEGTPISRANAERRMLEKLSRSLAEDIAPLLPPGVTFTDAEAITAFEKVWFDLIALIPGDPWKSSQAMIEQLRKDEISGAAKRRCWG